MRARVELRPIARNQAHMQLWLHRASEPHELYCLRDALVEDDAGKIKATIRGYVQADLRVSSRCLLSMPS
jgi:hypothetical protein